MSSKVAVELVLTASSHCSPAGSDWVHWSQGSLHPMMQVPPSQIPLAQKVPVPQGTAPFADGAVVT
jgi:hypothetical protein